MLDRRDFLKLTGTASLTALFGSALSGCSNDENEVTESAEEIEGAGENEYWIPTGNKTTFEANSHMIYEVYDFESYNYIESWHYNNEIKVPDGYAYVSSEPLTKKYGYGSMTQGIKYNYINTVPVEALEYQNTKTDEVAYPFAGTPLDLEKAQTTPKVYSKTM